MTIGLSTRDLLFFLAVFWYAFYMGLSIRILSGNLQGQSFRLSAGLRIGRKKADINLQDSKASNLHAIIQEDSDGSFSVIDTKSTNKIIHNGQILEQLKLSPGVQFTIGQSLLEVFDHDKIQVRSDLSWQEQVKNYATGFAEKLQQQPKNIDVFENPLHLRFVSGQQKNIEWRLAYGPRSFGPASVDLPILEFDCPDICFQVSKAKDGLEFKTRFAEKILLNDQNISQAILKVGDLIRIGNSKIQVVSL